MDMAMRQCKKPLELHLLVYLKTRYCRKFINNHVYFRTAQIPLSDKNCAQIVTAEYQLIFSQNMFFEKAMVTQHFSSQK